MGWCKTGIITSGLNHLAHSGINTFKKTYLDHLEEGGYNARDGAEPTHEYVMEMIDRIPLLKKWYMKGNKPEIVVLADKTGDGMYQSATHKVFIPKNFFDNNWRLFSVVLHESYHAYQYTAPVMNGMTITAWVNKHIGSTNNYPFAGKGWYLLELYAYKFEIINENNNPNTLWMYEQMTKKYENYGKN